MAEGGFRRFGHGGSKTFGSQSESALNLTPGTDIRAAVDQIGKQRLAEQISGTTDRNSREYKNARDYISRHLRGSRRTVTGSHAGRISEALREHKIEELRSRESLQVEVTADVQVSSRTWRGGKMRATLRGASLERYLDAVESGNNRAAMSEFLEGYGIGQTVRSIANVRGVSYG